MNPFGRFVLFGLPQRHQKDRWLFHEGLGVLFYLGFINTKKDTKKPNSSSSKRNSPWQKEAEANDLQTVRFHVVLGEPRANKKKGDPTTSFPAVDPSAKSVFRLLRVHCFNST